MSIMKITKIEPQKKTKGRFSVFIDEEFAFGISEGDLHRYQLQENALIPESLYDTIMENLVLKRAVFIGVNYISYKDRTEKEVRHKLHSCGEFDNGVIDEAIVSLKEKGYIDDDRYAELFATAKANNRLDGTYKIKRMLEEKGIKCQVDLEALGIDEVENAIELMELKFDLDDLDFNDKRRISNYLYRKGYSFSVINEAFKRVELTYNQY